MVLRIKIDQESLTTSATILAGSLGYILRKKNSRTAERLVPCTSTNL